MRVLNSEVFDSKCILKLLIYIWKDGIFKKCINLSMFNKLSALQSGETVDLPKMPQDKDSYGVRIPSELMDDFYVIAQ